MMENLYWKSSLEGELQSKSILGFLDLMETPKSRIEELSEATNVFWNIPGISKEGLEATLEKNTIIVRYKYFDINKLSTKDGVVSVHVTNEYVPKNSTIETFFGILKLSVPKKDKEPPIKLKVL